MKTSTTYAPVYSALIISEMLDHESSFQKSLKEVFDRIETASSADDALEKLQAKPYDVLFLDLNPFEHEITEMISNIRANGVVAPIVFICNQINTDLMLNAFHWGVIDFIEINAPHETILSIAQNVLQRHTDPATKQSFIDEVKRLINSRQFEQVKKSIESNVQKLKGEEWSESVILLALTYEILGVFENAEKVYKKILKKFYAETESVNTDEAVTPRLWLEERLTEAI
ncbi:MAG: response regulator [Verrucomicrobiota bacterium]